MGILALFLAYWIVYRTGQQLWLDIGPPSWGSGGGGSSGGGQRSGGRSGSSGSPGSRTGRVARGAYGAARGTGRLAATVGRSAAKGWREGAAEGRQRYEQRLARKTAAKDRDADTPPDRREPETYQDGDATTNPGSDGPTEAGTAAAASPPAPWGIEIIERTAPTNGNGNSINGGSTMTTPTSMESGEAVNIEGARQAWTSFEGFSAEQLDSATAREAAAAQDYDAAQVALTDAQAMAAAAETLMSSLADADAGPSDLAAAQQMQEIAARMEQSATESAAAAEADMAAARALQEIAEEAQAHASGSLSGMNSRHGQMEEAVNSAEHAARTEWYRH